MSVVRIVKNKNYITMGKYHLQEKEMSLKAIGLLSIMLGLPDDWDYSIKGLAKIRKESYDAIRTTLNELEQYGYLHRKQLTDEKGKFIDIEYTIYEKPITENPITDKPITENPTQYNNINKLSNKEKEINNKNKYGTFNNVKLTDEEYQKLKDTFIDYEEKIENLSYYLKSKGDKYKSHYATILNWARKEKKQEQPLPNWFNQEYKEKERTDEQERQLQELIRGNQR